MPSTFTTDDEHFLLDGKPFRILSGALHYFRIHPDYWEDRLNKARLMGLNTVELYVAWNFHEPTEGVFDFEGWRDIVRFIEIADSLGLKVIVRPGPFICAEWDLGGFPGWLIRSKEMRLRCSYKPYLEAVDRFFDALLPRLVPLQISRGGPIIAMQVENEYGSFGNDKAYLEYLEKSLQDRAIDCLLFTSDGPWESLMLDGSLPHLLKTGNFGSDSEDRLANIREFQPKGPLMCMEFWNGWFDHWGEMHHARDAQDAAKELDTLLAAGASVNIYMWHGGTNFGFWAGANCEKGQHQPTTTSYDYSAPLSEEGRLTDKYHAFREVIGRYTNLPDEALPEDVRTQALGQVQLTQSCSLMGQIDTLSTPIERCTPDCMEACGQQQGLILYRKQVDGPRGESSLILEECHDRAHVFLDGKLHGMVERNRPDQLLKMPATREGYQLDILVEAMGRVNYNAGNRLFDQKGITDCVRLDDVCLFEWTIFPLPFEDLSALRWSEAKAQEKPSFHRGTFEVEDCHDTYLSLPGWTKGVVWINGFNLGRYWEIGPQQTLYVPGPLLKTGQNELIILELDSCADSVEFCDAPDLGPTEPTPLG